MNEKSDSGDQDRILKSTSIIGLSSTVTAAFKVLQAKAVALLVGPSGLGMMGLFLSATSIANTVSGMGLDTSGVRDIAKASTSGDDKRISRTIRAFRRAVWVLGTMGALLFFIFRKEIAVATFGHDGQADAMGLLAVVPFLAVSASCESALLRGMRRIKDLALAGIVGTASGILLGLPVLFFLKERGIALYLVVGAASMWIVFMWYARKIRIERELLTIRETLREVGAMVSLGVVLMAGGLVELVAFYLVKVIITQRLGLAVTGLYEASSALSNVYVGFILSAMGADFFPHLSSVSNDDPKSERLIKAQVEIGVLIAAPAIVLVLGTAPYLLELLYSDKFVEAYEILRWQALGTFLRVVTWPIGFLVLARKKKTIYFFSQLGIDLFYFAAIYWGTLSFGIKGIGPSFFAMYLLYFVVMTLSAHRLIGFHWGPRHRALFFIAFSPALLVLGISYVAPGTVTTVAGILLSAALGIYALKKLPTITEKLMRLPLVKKAVRSKTQ